MYVHMSENFMPSMSGIIMEKTVFIRFGKHGGPYQLAFARQVAYNYFGTVTKIIRRINRTFAESEFAGQLVFARRGIVPRGESHVPKWSAPIMIPIQLFDLAFGQQIYQRRFRKMFGAYS